jgi:hypothetical protein
MRRTLDMARENMGDRAALLQRRIQGIDCSTGNTEGANNTFLFQNTHGRVDCSHLCHFHTLLDYSGRAIMGWNDEQSQLA